MFKFRVLAITLFMVLSSLAFSDEGTQPNQYVSQEGLFNKMFNSHNGTLAAGVRRGNVICVRSAVTTNDTSNPAIGSGADLRGWNRVFVEVDGTSGTSWNLTPLYGSASLGTYVTITGDDYVLESPTITVSGDGAVIMDAYGEEDFYIKLNGVVNEGMGTTVSIYLIPINL